MQRTITCAFIKEDGTRCRAAPLTNDKFCISHTTDPAAIEKKLIGSRRGGRAKKQPMAINGWEYRSISTTEDLRFGLSELFNAGMLGKIPVSQLAALSQVSNALLKILEPPRVEGDQGSLDKLLMAFVEERHPELRQELIEHMRGADAH